MKRSYTLFLGLLLLAACGKDNNQVAPQEPAAKVDTMKYAVTGFQDLVLQPTDSIDLQLMAKYASGQKENLSVALISLPAGMSVNFSPHADTPDFNINFRFYTQKTKVGKYPTQFIASSLSGVKYYSFNITVSPYKDEPLNVIGFYKEAGNCVVTSAINHNISVTQVAAVPNRVTINDLWLTNGNFNVYADLDTAHKTLTIPTQTTNGFSFRGSGTYTYAQMNIHYKITGASVSDSCTTVLTKQ